MTLSLAFVKCGLSIADTLKIRTKIISMNVKLKHWIDLASQYLALMWRLKLLTCGKCEACETVIKCSDDPSCDWADGPSKMPCPFGPIEFGCGSELFCEWANMACCWCDCRIFISGWMWICDGKIGGNILSTIWKSRRNLVKSDFNRSWFAYPH